jgi:hypothetical protein
MSGESQFNISLEFNRIPMPDLQEGFPSRRRGLVQSTVAPGGPVRWSQAAEPPLSRMGMVADRTFPRLGDNGMAFQASLTTREIGQIFAEEILAVGGSVSDTFDDGNRLFIRAILPAEREVKARDRVQGGVALRAKETEIWVHPYVFRQVCQNGAIIAHAAESRLIECADFHFDPETELVAALREAVRCCCADEAFETATAEMRSSVRSKIDFALTIMPTLSRLPSEVAAELLTAITDRYLEGRDPSRFGAVNAVTSVARDTSDPDVRWQLEEIGGGFLAEIHARDRQLLPA